MSNTRLAFTKATSFRDGMEFNCTLDKNYVSKAILKGNKIIISYEEASKDNSIPLFYVILFIELIVTSIFLRPTNWMVCMLTVSFLFHFLAFICIIAWRRTFQKSLYRFHAAEHMAIQAYESLQKVPTLAEIKKFSRFSKECSTSRYFGCVLVNALFLIIYLISPNDFSCILLSLLTSLIMVKYRKCICNSFIFLQYFTTLPPTDKELLVAIYALKEWELHEFAPAWLSL